MRSTDELDRPPVSLILTTDVVPLAIRTERLEVLLARRSDRLGIARRSGSERG
jgi:hypothetical protein